MLFVLALVASSAPIWDEEIAPAPRVIAETHRMHEAWGGPLPSGVIARLGTPKLYSGFNLVMPGPAGALVSAAPYYVGLQKWDARTGKLLATAPLPYEQDVQAAAVSADGKLGALASNEKVFIVDLASLKTLASWDTGLSMNGYVLGIAFLPNGRVALGGCANNPSRALRLFTTSGEEKGGITVPPPKESYSQACAGPLAVSADGRRLAAVVNNKAVVFELPSDEPIAQFESGAAATAVAFSPDGRQLLVGGYSAAVNAFDLASKRAVHSYGYYNYEDDREVRAVAFSPDGKLVIVAARDTRVFDAATGLERGRLESAAGPPNKAPSFAFAAGLLAYPMRAPDVIGRFSLDTLSQQEPYDLGRHDSNIDDGAFSPDGADVFTSSRDGTVRRWDAKTGAPRATSALGLGGFPFVVAPSLGVLVLGPDCTLLTLDAATLGRKDELALSPRPKGDGCQARGLALSTDGKRAIAQTQGAVFAVDLERRTVDASSPRPKVNAAPVQLLSDGSVGLLEDGKLVVLAAANLKPKRTVALDSEAWVASPKALVGARCHDRDVVLLDLATGKARDAKPLPEDVTFVRGCVFSADGARLYAGINGKRGSGVVVIDVKSGSMVSRLDGLTLGESSSPDFVALSADGRHLLEGSSDGLGLVVDVAAIRGGAR